MEEHKIGKSRHVPKNPEMIGKQFKEALCDKYDERLEDNTVSKEFK